MNPKTEQVMLLNKEGWSLRNIAQEVGVSVYTVWSIINNATEPPVLETEGATLSDFSKIQKEQSTLTRRFNRMVNELVDNSDDCDWDIEEFNDFIHNAKRLKNDVVNVCKVMGKDHEDLAIYQHTDQIVASMEQVYDEHQSNDEDTIILDLPEEIQASIEELEIDAFDDEFEGEYDLLFRFVLNEDDEDED